MVEEAGIGWLIDRLSAGEPSEEMAARALGLGLRNLQRRLQEEGTTYREALNQTRLWMAREYLGEGRTSMTEIAFLLGFTDTSSFSRAFRRWTGLSHAPTAPTAGIRVGAASADACPARPVDQPTRGGAAAVERRRSLDQHLAQRGDLVGNESRELRTQISLLPRSRRCRLASPPCLPEHFRRAISPPRIAGRPVVCRLYFSDSP